MKTILVVGENCSREELVEIAGQIFPWHNAPMLVCDLANALECIELKRPEILLFWLSEEYESWCKGLANRLDPGAMAFWMHDSFRMNYLRFQLPNLIQALWNIETHIQPEAQKMGSSNLEKRKLKRLLLHTLDSILFVDVNEILFCKAEASYCRIVFDESKEIIISKPIKEIEAFLKDEGFYRVHKSYLVPIAKVKAVHRSEGLEIELLGGIKVPIAFRKKDDFLSYVKAHLHYYIA